MLYSLKRHSDGDFQFVNVFSFWLVLNNNNYRKIILTYLRHNASIIAWTRLYQLFFDWWLIGITRLYQLFLDWWLIGITRLNQLFFEWWLMNKVYRLSEFLYLHPVFSKLLKKHISKHSSSSGKWHHNSENIHSFVNNIMSYSVLIVNIQLLYFVTLTSIVSLHIAELA